MSRRRVRWRANPTFCANCAMNWVEVAWTMMIAASLMLGVVHLFVWQKQRSQYANLLFFVLAVSAAAYGAYELARMQRRDTSRICRQHTLVSCATRGIRSLNRGIRAPLLQCGPRLARLRGDRDSAGRPRAEFPDGRERELPGNHGAGPSATLWGRSRRRSYRDPQSVGDRPAAQQPAARRVHRRCLHHPVAQGWAGGTPPRRPRRWQSCSLHRRRLPASPHWSSPEWSTRPPF